MAMTLSCDGNAICYVLPVLWMTSCFHTMEVYLDQIKVDVYVSSTSPGGGSGAKSAI